MTDNVAAALAICAMGLLISAQVFYAARHKGPLSVILAMQATFWTLAYVLRPAYLLVAKPIISDELADARMMVQGYPSAIRDALWPVVLGQAAFLLSVVLFSRFFTRRASSTDLAGAETRALTIAALCLWVVGWIFRLPISDGSEQFASIFRSFAPVGAGMLIFLLPSRRWKALPPVLLPIFAGEIFTAINDGSKTALVVPALALILRWNRFQVERPLRKLVVLGVIILAGFAIIQPLKGIDTAERVAASTQGPGAAVRGQAIGLLERFDGLTAVEDAEAMKPRTWLTPSEFLARGAKYLVPGLGEETTLGQRWTREVRSLSVPNQYQDVSLAAGPTAEGIAVAGLPGALVENVLLALATALAGAGLASRRPLFILLACVMVFSTTLFELGLLGITQRLNRIILLIGVLIILLPITRAIARRFGNTMKPTDDFTRSSLDRIYQ